MTCEKCQGKGYIASGLQAGCQCPACAGKGQTSGHKWKSERQMTDYGTGYEYITVCDTCGIEHPGEEFLDRELYT